MALVIRRLSLDDDLVSVCAQMQPDLWGADNEMSSYLPEELERFLEERGIALLAYRDNRIAAIAICHVLPHPSGLDSLYVHELDTHPDFRRQGIGAALMKKVFDLAAELGMVEVWLGADEGNAPAHNLYRKLEPSEIDPCTVYVYKLD